MAVPRAGRAAVLAGVLAAGSAHAGSTLAVVISVVQASGPCGAAVASSGVTVSCGPSPIPSLAPPITGGAAESPVFAGGLLGTGIPPYVDPAVGETPAGADAVPSVFNLDGPDRQREGEGLRQVGLLPPSVTGRQPVPVYAGGVNVTGWRVVAVNDNRHVEVIISW